MIGFGTTGFSQTEITWDDLEIDSISEQYNEEYKSTVRIFHLSEKAKNLHLKKIEITGYLMPIDASIGYNFLLEDEFLLNCICHLITDGAISFDLQLGALPRNTKVKLTGTMIISEGDILKSNYTLEDVKMISYELPKVVYKENDTTYINSKVITWDQLKNDADLTKNYTNKNSFKLNSFKYTRKQKKLNYQYVSISGQVIISKLNDGTFTSGIAKPNLTSGTFSISQSIEVQFKKYPAEALNSEGTITGKLTLNLGKNGNWVYRLVDAEIVKN
ncbi:MAG: hypothetical protein ACI8Q1_002055 [Parvicella sp.]